jgi:mannitol-specific phosphotransferase system IIBC component
MNIWGKKVKFYLFLLLPTSLITINYLSYFLRLDTNKQKQTNKNKQTKTNKQKQTNKNKQTKTNKQKQTNKNKQTKTDSLGFAEKL